MICWRNILSGRNRLGQTSHCLKPGVKSAWNKNLQNPSTKSACCMIVRFLQTGDSKHTPHLSDPENTGKRQKGVNFDTLGSWNNRLDMPISVKQSIEKGRLIPKIPVDEIGTASLLGRRKVNEDRLSYEQISDDLMYFAIFDGHGGNTAVDFAQKFMLKHIEYWLTKTSNLFDVLHNSFIEVNNLLTRHIVTYSLGTEGSTGTTATVCLLRNGIELVVAHVGDSRAIMCREGESLRLSHDHVPDDQEEAVRIKQCGGSIVDNSLGVSHVNGRLTMTRSIGDIELKPFGVTAEPYIRSIRIKHGVDAFLLLNTDGLSFVLNDQELMDIITSCSTPSEAAHLITDQALQFGSEDNSTAMVIPFGAWGKYRSTTRSIPYSFGRNLSSNRYS
ncbi:Protein phosphatase 1K [Mactra antiquata]